MSNLPILRRLFDIAEAARLAGIESTEANLTAIAYLLQDHFQVPLGCRFQIFGHSLWSNELQDQLGALLAYEYFTYQSGCGAAQLVPGRCANSLLRFSEPLSLEHTDRVDALLRALLARPAVSLSAVASAACLLMSKGEGGTAEDLVNRLACPAGAAPLVVSRAKELVAMARSSKSYALAHAAN